MTDNVAAGGDGALFRVNPATGERTTLASGDPFVNPVGVAVEPPNCAGRPATIVGSNVKDVLVGSPFPDVIAALGGKDVVRAGGGKDFVCGGAGKDRLKGGAGKDRLLGGKGADRCIGGKGRDSGKGCERGKL